MHAMHPSLTFQKKFVGDQLLTLSATGMLVASTVALLMRGKCQTSLSACIRACIKNFYYLMFTVQIEKENDNFKESLLKIHSWE